MKIINDILKLMVLASMLVWGSAAAQSVEETRGLDIARKMKAQEKGFDNYSARMSMILIGVNGRERVRRFRIKILEVKGDGDKSLAIFDSPADVRGTAFLSHTHLVGDDDQWLYLPSLKQVKRISPRNKTAPFMGSEFSYEDLVSYEVEKYTYRYIGDEVLDEEDYFIIDRFPVGEHSGYSRQRVWVEKKRYLPLKIDYFNRRQQKAKTLEFRKYTQYLDRFWRPHQMYMLNYISGKSSILDWQQYKFRQELNSTDFNPGSMKRIR